MSRHKDLVFSKRFQEGLSYYLDSKIKENNPELVNYPQYE